MKVLAPWYINGIVLGDILNSYAGRDETKTARMFIHRIGGTRGVDVSKHVPAAEVSDSQSMEKNGRNAWTSTLNHYHILKTWKIMGIKHAVTVKHNRSFPPYAIQPT